MNCFEKRDTKEKLGLNCGVTVELCNSALARSERDDWPVHTQTGYTLKPWHRNCKKKSPWIEVILLIYYFSARNRNVCRILPNMSVSTHEYHHSMWGKHSISLVEITEKIPATTPPPHRISNLVGFRRWRGKSATTPPPSPTESRRLLEITEKTQEIKQAQLGSSEVPGNISIAHGTGRRHGIGSGNLIISHVYSKLLCRQQCTVSFYALIRYERWVTNKIFHQPRRFSAKNAVVKYI